MGRRVIPSIVESSSINEASEADIERINELIKTARGLWLGLLGVLVFTGITLLGVEDIDFFGLDRSVQLPLVNVSVPTTSFFWAAPALVAAAYTYMLFYLEYLWVELGNIKPRHKGKLISECITPWMVSDNALRFRSERRSGKPTTERFWLRNVWKNILHYARRLFGIASIPDNTKSKPAPAEDERCHKERTAGSFRYAANTVLVWMLAPFIIFLFWARFTSTHYVFTNCLIAILFAFSIWIGLTGFRYSRCLLGEPRQKYKPEPARHLAMLIALAMIPVTAVKTTTSIPHTAFQFWTDISGGSSEALACSEMKWETKENNNNTVEGNKRLAGDKALKELHKSHLAAIFMPAIANLPKAQITERPDGWLPENLARKNYNTLLVQPISNRDLITEWKTFRKAKIDNLRTPELWNHDFTFADLGGAFMAGAQFRHSDLSNAYMRNAILEEANFKDAKLTNTNLVRAHLEGADFRKATVINSDFQQARMHHADLDRDANFKSTCFRFADMELVDMQWSYFEDVSFYGANLTNTEFRRTTLKNIDMRAARLFGIGPADNKKWRWQKGERNPERIKTKEQDYLLFLICDCKDNVTEFRKVDVDRAGFRYFDFRKMHGTFKDDPKPGIRPIRYVDITSELKNFDLSFGDATSLFPNPDESGTDVLKRPEHWSTKALNRNTFLVCWRSWLEAHGTSRDELFALGLTNYRQIDWLEAKDLCRYEHHGLEESS
ncbi:MAG: pentapeptide repeat-containing protein [Pseudomonadota bacterium]